MSAYDNVPRKATLQLSKFNAAVSEDELSEFKQLIKLSKIGPKTYENLQEDRRYGMTHSWLSDAKSYWENKYDWRATEKRINSFPNYTTSIKDDDGKEFTIHFVALFSEKQDAIPITFLHGWPGSFLEFLSMLEVFKKKYSAKELPFHLIVPSLPGYGYSSGPPLDKNWSFADAARMINKLMVGLGFGSGYVSQGGDIGSFLSRVLAAKFDECKAMHINMCPAPAPKENKWDGVNEAEKEAVPRGETFSKTGSAYANMHGTRPATIGLVLSSNPIALLAWIGEKFLEWTDTDPSTDEILDDVTLYWFTQSFPRSIYPYRALHGAETTKDTPTGKNPEFYVEKPFGYSFFPFEIMPTPKAWAEKTGNLVWHRQHEHGGHFAAMEKPEVLAKDIEDFVAQVWEGTKSGSVKSEL